MRVLISGGGIAGLTLAFWLKRGGHDPLVVERSPALRDEGYMIDFFGSGYDVSERMGILANLERIHYQIPRLTFVDASGAEKFSIDYPVLRKLFGGRHFNFMRGDLERVLYSKVKDDVEFRFNTTVESFEQDTGAVHVKLSDGSTASFDLLVGADGVHSWVRQLAFGEEGQFSRFLGCYTAAFIITDPTKSLALPDTLYTLTVLEKQVGIYPIRGGRLATFFVYRRHQLLNNFSFEMAVRELRTAYGGLNWIVPELLERCDRSSMYLDEVSQVEMARWSLGRVTLIGDACHCVSLLAGQGASLAMASAYILADELAKSRSDVAGALAHYERKLRPKIEKKQKAGRRLARWFVPANRVDLAIRDFVMRMAAWPITSHLLRFTFSPESVI